MHYRSLAFLAALSAAVFPLHAADPQSVDATAELIDNDGHVVGTAELRQGPAGVLVELEIDGLESGWKAIHIHQTGTCADAEEGFQDSGGHLNPEGASHGFLNPDGPDAGDLPNVHVSAHGTARVELFNERVSLDGSREADLLAGDGTALVMHEDPDDHETQPIGGAGARVACGVVEAQ